MTGEVRDGDDVAADEVEARDFDLACVVGGCKSSKSTASFMTLLMFRLIFRFDAVIP